MVWTLTLRGKSVLITSGWLQLALGLWQTQTTQIHRQFFGFLDFYVPSFYRCTFFIFFFDITSSQKNWLVIEGSCPMSRLSYDQRKRGLLHQCSSVQSITCRLSEMWLPTERRHATLQFSFAPQTILASFYFCFGFMARNFTRGTFTVCKQAPMNHLCTTCPARNNRRPLVINWWA